MFLHRPALLGALALACASCLSPVDQPGSTVPGRCVAEAPLIEPQETDILFVIDNSGSMAEEQANLALELPAFIEELKTGGGAAHDFQVGVITTSIYQNAQLQSGQVIYQEYPEESGKLRPVPDEAGAATQEKVISSSDPALVAKFARLVQQGIVGSGQETPFEAVRLAVTDLAQVPTSEGGNQGFLRDGARLLVVVVSDEDDCSERARRPPQVTVGQQQGRDYCREQQDKLTPVAEYYDLFKGLTDSGGALKQVLWAAIAPVSRTTKEAQSIIDQSGVLRNADCPTSVQPGFRQREMASLFDPSLANLDSICNESYRQSLLAIAQIANVNQTLEVRNVPDPRLLQVAITRADGQVQVPLCTVANGGVRYEPGEGERPGRIHFEGTCLRKPNDVSVEVRMLCAA
jgi:hypothetical protein